MTWARYPAAVLAVLALGACGRPQPPMAAPAVPVPVLSGPPPAFLLYPAVSQATIAATICVSGWTATVRPPAAFTTALKRRQIAARHLVPATLSAYEEDHLEPLELGGAPVDERNLWPQPIAQARVKDRDEDRLRAAVCAGRLGLDAARAQMYAKWGSYAAGS